MIVTLFEEINDYHPKDQPMPTASIIETRTLRNKKSLSDNEYEKFWRKADNADWLEDKYKIELYNRDCFLRLYTLYKETESNSKENVAVLKKLQQFKSKIETYADKPLAGLTIDFSKFDMPQDAEIEMDWEE